MSFFLLVLTDWKQRKGCLSGNQNFSLLLHVRFFTAKFKSIALPSRKGLMWLFLRRKKSSWFFLLLLPWFFVADCFFHPISSFADLKFMESEFISLFSVFVVITLTVVSGCFLFITDIILVFFTIEKITARESIVTHKELEDESRDECVWKSSISCLLLMSVYSWGIRWSFKSFFIEFIFL